MKGLVSVVGWIGLTGITLFAEADHLRHLIYLREVTDLWHGAKAGTSTPTFSPAAQPVLRGSSIGDSDTCRPQ